MYIFFKNVVCGWWLVCMYVHICTYVTMYVCTCMYVTMYVCTCMYVVCIYVCMYVCMYVYIFVCMYVCMYIHICMYMYMYTLLLLGSAEKLFTQCEEYADNQKKKSQIWPLQKTLLLLCPLRPSSMSFSLSLYISLSLALSQTRAISLTVI